MISVLVSLLWLTFLSHEYMDEENEVAHGIKIGSFQLKYPTFWDIFSHTEAIKNDKAMAIIQGKSPENTSKKDTLATGQFNTKTFVFPEDMTQLRDSIVGTSYQRARKAPTYALGRNLQAGYFEPV